ncbi:MAG TPA: 16S rRNA (guanine(527)-N(7))-methyltransferase RsmG [Candidatus Acidoferrales bacterium]|nr:16S rRNA (guanine(527)-N(7))-methyltransferase RsmG [Candidatus Acidoferrales bacterium]
MRRILEPYGTSVSESESAKIRAYIELLTAWNRKIALTAVKSEDEILRFHFGESLFALKKWSIEKGRLADVGTGAGFPGLALKIVRPELRVTVIDPNKKKCAFLHEVVRVLEFRDVEIQPTSFEAVSIEAGALSCVTSRALGVTPKFLSWSRSKLDAAGRILLWIGKDDCRDLLAVSEWSWGEPTLIPGTSNRMILAGTPKNPH